MKKKKIDWMAYAFIAPFVILSIIFMIVPICQGVYNSLFDFRFGGSFVGLENYKIVFQNPLYTKAIVNSLIIVVIVVPIMIILGILIAGSVFDKVKGYVSFVRICLYIPVISSMVVMSIIWRFILDSQSGLARYFFDIFHMTPINFLGNSTWAMVIVIFVLFTMTIGQSVVLYIAAMIGIPKELIEALQIDGGNRWNLFKSILIPLTKPTTLFIFITQTSAMLRAFVVIQLLTNGGPNNSTNTMMYLLYREGFELGNFGSASALGVVMFILSLLLVLLQFKRIEVK